MLLVDNNFYPAKPSAFLFAVAAAMLLTAIIPAILYGSKFKKTFAFKNHYHPLLLFGFSMMMIGSSLFLACVWLGSGWVGFRSTNTMFISLTVFCFAQVVINLFFLFIKRKNINESNSMGITEQKYWETVVSPTLKK